MKSSSNIYSMLLTEEFIREKIHQHNENKFYEHFK